MTPTELYLAAIDGRTDIIVATAQTLATLLAKAADDILLILARQPSDYQRWYLPALAQQVRQQMTVVGGDAAETLAQAEARIWTLGEALPDNLVRNAGLGIALPRLDTAQLLAMQAFATERIAGISLEGANRINDELGRVIIGAQTTYEAMEAVSGILEDATLRRATTVVNTSLAQAHSTATQLRMEQLAADVVPELKKKWIKSGKREPRPAHAVINGQIKPVNEPFVLKGGAVRMMHPHDPAAPAGEVINCGCISVPVVE